MVRIYTIEVKKTYQRLNEFLKQSKYFSCYELRFPFEWKTPAGYLMAWLIQCIGAMPATINTVHFLNVIFGPGWLFICIAEDITQHVTAFNINVQSTSDKYRTKLPKSFCDLVQIYSDAKQ